MALLLIFPGGIPSQADQDAWTVEYEVWKSATDEITHLESLETPRRLAEAVLTLEGKTWLEANRALIAIERAKI
jgi:hypothetical protein